MPIRPMRSQAILRLRESTWAEPGDRFAFTAANGAPAIYMTRDGGPYAVIALQMSNDGVVGVRSLLNPDRVGYLAAVPAPIEIPIE